MSPTRPVDLPAQFFHFIMDRELAASLNVTGDELPTGLARSAQRRQCRVYRIPSENRVFWSWLLVRPEIVVRPDAPYLVFTPRNNDAP